MQQSFISLLPHVYSKVLISSMKSYLPMYMCCWAALVAQHHDACTGCNLMHTANKLSSNCDPGGMLCCLSSTCYRTMPTLPLKPMHCTTIHSLL